MKAMDKYTQEEQQLMQILMYDGPECSVYSDLQVWAMKNDRVDRRLIRDLEMAYQDDVSNSPPLPSFMAAERGPEMTAFGPWNDPASRRIFQQCIATLNKCYEHHVFNNAKPSDFVKEDLANVLNSLSNAFPKSASGLSAPRSYSSYPPINPEFFPPAVPTSSSPIDYARPSPYAPPQTISGTDPILYSKLSQLVELRDCEAYAYIPDIEADPHYDDDDYDEEGGDEAGSSSEEEDLFPFDRYDVDEPELDGHEVASNESDDLPATRPSRHRGPTLWSSHYFFVSKKQKRILYLSLWAKAKTVGAWLELAHDHLGFTETVRGERFHGWEGAAGTGARAMGLAV
ncbi:hypothetical protein EIP86_005970 [Pleurotus ostreatoroseus]|nr:hypothetical protein EIP86_005970 [Pleurotus ostreatoroseus]